MVRVESLWVYWCRVLYHTLVIRGQDHALDSIHLGHLLSVLFRLVRCLYLNLTLHDDFLLFTFNLLFTMSRTLVHLSLKHFIFVISFGKFSLDLFEHLRLNHPSEGVLHCIACGLESTETCACFGLILLKLPLDLRVKQYLNEAALGDTSTLIFIN